LSESILAPQFDTLEQQHDTRTFGMWVFLATELMLFGGLFTAYAAYRAQYPDVFAEASRHLNLTLGSVNTVVLILSSLTMALAVQRAQLSKRFGTIFFLMLTNALGTLFMLIKGVEYYQHFVDHLVPGLTFVYFGGHAQQAPLFFLLYFAMTGLHTIHLTIGIGLVAVMIERALFGQFSRGNYAAVEITGLYWHFVDIIWIFLFPLLYLAGGH